MIILTPPKKNVSSGTSEELGNFPSKESACSAGDCCWVEKISWRRSPLQCPCLENPMDRGALWATVQGVTKSQIGLSDQAQHWGITPVSPGVIWPSQTNLWLSKVYKFSLLIWGLQMQKRVCTSWLMKVHISFTYNKYLLCGLVWAGRVWGRGMSVGKGSINLSGIWASTLVRLYTGNPK